MELAKYRPIQSALPLTAKASVETLDNNKKEAVMKALRNTMRPELLNRFDQIILFNSLGDKEISAIFDLAMSNLNERLAGQGVALLITPKLKKWLINKGK